MTKRIFLFFLTNFLILLTISFSLTLLGVGPYLSEKGIDTSALVIFCAAWGFGGAFVSLALSRWMAKRIMGVVIIDPGNPRSETERWLLDRVRTLSSSVGLEKTPEIGIYDADDANAFATGPSRNRSLVAVSTGLLRKMERNGVEAVLAHEIAHIANGDMVTMTLLQGVVNTLVMFIARLAGWSAGQLVDESKRQTVNFSVVIALEILLGLAGSLVVAWFSRQREFRADAGGASMVGPQKMILALSSLDRISNGVLIENEESSDRMSAFKIARSGKRKFASFFSTHPPIADRITRLQNHHRG